MTQKTTKDLFELYLATDSRKDKKFSDIPTETKDDLNGNSDDVFKASKVKYVKRSTEHGYDPGDDIAAYEKSNKRKGTEPTSTYTQKLVATNEEVEQIDEISKKTLGSYVKKAAADIEDDAYFAGRESDPKKRPYDEWNPKKSDNRHKGINKAVNRLTKESTIDKFIENYVDGKVNQVPKRDLVESNIASMSKSTVDLLLNLFDSLDEENQLTFVEMSETQEGINEMLDFAIRGNI